jgi:hypothetical protein
MPADSIGQEITFASQLDPDQRYTQYVYTRARVNDTIRKIASRLGQPEMVPTILALNADVRIRNGHKLRSATQELNHNQIIRLPGTLAQQDAFSVHCGDERPIIKDGYAVYDTVDRPGRVGLNRFKGYHPIEMDVSLQFEAFESNDGAGIEDKIARLERMAGRGDYGGAASGPPSVIRLSTTDNSGRVVPLIPPNYQWSPQNPTAPLYRISQITWGPGALSDRQGRRIRQSATITVKQYTPLTNIKRSASQRARSKVYHSTGAAITFPNPPPGGSLTF